MTDVEDGIASVKARPSPIRGEPVARSVAIGCRSSAVPGGAIINAVAPGVVDVEHQAMARLLLNSQLEGVVNGVGGVLPHAQSAVVAVEFAAGLAAQRTPNIVRDASPQREMAAGNTVHVISPK